MAYNFKEVMSKKERFTPGHRMCAGCGAPIAVRNVLRALKDEDKAVVTCATTHLQTPASVDALGVGIQAVAE